ncbi:MAG: ATP-dependent DNA helicase [Eubacteriales bacterium]|nr:ATP-dependent DNA helicase [Eubacteriales bacterium]
MNYRNQYQRKAYQELDLVFLKLLPQAGLSVRKEQIKLSHQMLEALLEGKIALCDAGVGIGKTYAYLVACVLMRKYAGTMGNRWLCDKRPVVISTSSIALQEAIIQEYIPFLSEIFQEAGLISSPLKAVVRKGKEHFVCDSRLETRIEAIRGKVKNEAQKKALFSLKHIYDMDEVPNLSPFDRRLVSVPKFCPRECPGKTSCRYQVYLKQARDTDNFFQICNHNYLLADSYHREKGYKPLLADYRALIVDEAHKLPETARQMYGKSLCYEDILEICYFLEREYQGEAAKQLRGIFQNLFYVISENHMTEHGLATAFHMTEECSLVIEEGKNTLESLEKKLRGLVPGWIRNQLEEAMEILSIFSGNGKHDILHLEKEREKLPKLCATSRKIPDLLSEMLWSRGFPAILTSGTLKAGKGFSRTRQENGLEKESRVMEYVAESPFAYEKNCLLYLPQTLKRTRHGSQEEAAVLAEHIQRLICSTYGHTLVLFTSYSLMGNVYQILRDNLPFPMIEVWRNAQEEIMRFKTLENAVLFAAGSCWEGVDFPGDMVSSLIIVRLPFAVPDPLREAEREQYDSLEDYIHDSIVPDMQKRLRQGFGRALRTECDTCVVSILDRRAAAGGRYHEEVLCALPVCQMAETMEDVEDFIRRQKPEEYYM